MRNLSHRQHLRQQLRDLHRCRTNKGRTSGVTHLLDFLDYGVIFLTGCLIYTVILVVTDHRTVGGNLHHVEFVDIPELTSLCRSGTGHTCQLMIHTEVVLQGDGSECLCGSFYLHVLLCLHSLVQSVAPTTTFHNTTRLLIHDLYLAVNHHILIILIEHAVSLQQLLQGMYTLALNGVVAHQLVLLIQTLLIGQTCLSLKCREL